MEERRERVIRLSSDSIMSYMRFPSVTIYPDTGHVVPG